MCKKWYGPKNIIFSDFFKNKNKNVQNQFWSIIGHSFKQHACLIVDGNLLCKQKKNKVLFENQLLTFCVLLLALGGAVLYCLCTWLSFINAVTTVFKNEDLPAPTPPNIVMFINGAFSWIESGNSWKYFKKRCLTFKGNQII